MSDETIKERERRAFNHGYLLAAANIVHLHDEPGIAEDVLRELCLDAKEIRGMELCDYDMKALAPILGNMKRKAAYARQREAARIPLAGNVEE